MTDYKYARVIIKGTLTTQSPLHIGTGEVEQNKEGTTNTIALSCGKNQTPYILASSLRGSLRALCKDAKQNKIIYGDARQKKNSKVTGASGAMRIYDAVAQGKQCKLIEISRTQIDALTNTAKEHQLSTHTLVAENAVFNLELHLDRVNDEEINTVLASLEALQHSSMGKGKSIGQGKVLWLLDKTASQFLDKQTLKKWLSSEKKYNLKNQYRALGKFIDKQNDVAVLESDWQTQEITLIAQSPLLIHDPATLKQEEEHIEAKKQQLLKAMEEHDDCTAAEALRKQIEALVQPKLISMKRVIKGEKKAIIPASSIKGWMRARCKKILKTISQNEAEIEAMLTILFGSTETGTGKLRFSDATTTWHKADEHDQYFTAIDRFTGGVKKTALYCVKAIYPGQPFTLQIAYPKDKKPVRDGVKLLLLFVARDAIEGDLVLGWGKSKGYGRLKMQTDFDVLLNQYDTELASWQYDLENQLSAKTKEQAT